MKLRESGELVAGVADPCDMSVDGRALNSIRARPFTRVFKYCNCPATVLTVVVNNDSRVYEN